MNSLRGTTTLIRLALRRDRVLLPVWIAAFVGIAAGSAAATKDLYPTVPSRLQAAESINTTSSLVALYGRVYDPSSLGAVSLIKMIAFGAALLAILSVIVMVRHTRAEEEAGRLELVGATVVGRYAPLTAASLLTAGTNLVLGGLTALGLVVVGLPASGAWAFGLSWAATGLSFAAVAALFCQLTDSARAATGMSCAALGGAYLFRAVGDTTATGAGDSTLSWLSWCSPVGWGQQVRPFAGDRWWALVLPVLFTVLVSTIAYMLVARRDHGAGLLPHRPGPATAPATLRGPLALAWRLHRGTLLGWTAGFAVLGAVFGSIASSVGPLLGSPQAQEMLTGLGGTRSLTDAFLAAELGITGVLASAFGVQACLRLRAEETAQRVAPLLAAPIGRTRWAASHLAVAFIGTAVLLTAAGFAAGASYAASTGESEQAGRVVLGALVQVPAAWVITSLVVLAFGLAPRFVVLGWAALLALLLLGEFGPLFQLDRWVMDLSPFAHTPKLPGGELTAAPLLALVAVAALLVGIGLAGFRRRDVS